MLDDPALAWVPALASAYNSTRLLPNGLSLQLDILPYSAMHERLTRDTAVALFEQAPENLWDSVGWRELLLDSVPDATAGWLLPGSMLQTLSAAGVLEDLGMRMWEDARLAYPGVGMFHRRVASLSDRRLVGVPVAGSALQLYLRSDVYTAVPAVLSWEAVIGMVVTAQQAGAGSGGGVKHAFCMDLVSESCPGSAATLMAVAAPYIQYNGSSQV